MPFVRRLSISIFKNVGADFASRGEHNEVEMSDVLEIAR